MQSLSGGGGGGGGPIPKERLDTEPISSLGIKNFVAYHLQKVCMCLVGSNRQKLLAITRIEYLVPFFLFRP